MISEKLGQVILKTLELDDFEFRDETRACDVPGWDSLSHVQVIMAVEQYFQIRFKTGELLRLKNVGDLQALIDSKTAV